MERFAKCCILDVWQGSEYASENKPPPPLPALVNTSNQKFEFFPCNSRIISIKILHGLVDGINHLDIFWGRGLYYELYHQNLAKKCTFSGTDRPVNVVNSLAITSQFTCNANKLTGFYTITALIFRGLHKHTTKMKQKNSSFLKAICIIVWNLLKSLTETRLCSEIPLFSYGLLFAATCPLSSAFCFWDESSCSISNLKKKENGYD